MKTANNPLQMLSAIAQNNPAVADTIKMCQGRNPRDVFYSECERRGINPEEVISLLK